MIEPSKQFPYDRYKTTSSSKRVKFSDDKFDQLNLNSSQDERVSLVSGGGPYLKSQLASHSENKQNLGILYHEQSQLQSSQRPKYPSLRNKSIKKDKDDHSTEEKKMINQQKMRRSNQSPIVKQIQSIKNHKFGRLSSDCKGNSNSNTNSTTKKFMRSSEKHQQQSRGRSAKKDFKQSAFASFASKMSYRNYESSGSATLKDLRPQDKQKIGDLVKTLAIEKKQKSDLKEEISQIKNSLTRKMRQMQNNHQRSQELLKSKLSQSMLLLSTISVNNQTNEVGKQYAFLIDLQKAKQSKKQHMQEQMTISLSQQIPQRERFNNQQKSPINIQTFSTIQSQKQLISQQSAQSTPIAGSTANDLNHLLLNQNRFIQNTIPAAQQFRKLNAKDYYQQHQEQPSKKTEQLQKFKRQSLQLQVHQQQQKFEQDNLEEITNSPMSIADDAWNQINKVKYEFADLKNKIAVSSQLSILISFTQQNKQNPITKNRPITPIQDNSELSKRDYSPAQTQPTLQSKNLKLKAID